MIGLFFQYGIVLQALAIVHFVRRRPESYWLFIILIGGAVGALAYIALEVIPDAGLLRVAFQAFPRRKRIKELQIAIIDNPSIGNYEELGDLYLDDKQYAKARECLDRVVSASNRSPDPFYRRALAAVAMGDFQAAVADLDQVYERDPRYDYQRAAGLRAHALGKIGEREKAAELFADVTTTSTLSETQYNYACSAGRARAHGGSSRVGRARAREETDRARVRPSSRTSMVSQGRGPAQTASAFGAAVIVFWVLRRRTSPLHRRTERSAMKRLYCLLVLSVAPVLVAASDGPARGHAGRNPCGSSPSAHIQTTPS